MNKMKAWQGSLGISPYSGIVSPAYFVFRAIHSETPSFLHYLLRSDHFSSAFMTISKGIRINQWDIDPDYLSLLPVPLPPTSEQTVIAAFLDSETARIDALIEEQQRLIELLKEKRQAVISHAVTKGLDPTTPTKYSGVEWLGEVPAHWEKTHLRYVASLNPSKSTTSELPDEFEVVFLPMESIGEDGAIDRSQTRQLGDVRSGYSYFANGDVVLAKVTPCFENGKGAPVKGLPSHHGFGTTELTVLRPLTPDDQNFIWWLTASAAFRLPAKAEMVGAGGLKRVPDQFVAGFQLAWPPASERSSIATFLDRETIRIDTLVSEAEVSISLLQERRSTLISAAVTGKIDVRGAVDPSRKPEPEPV